MDSADFQKRTKKLGLLVIELVELLPQTKAASVIAGQILRCSLSVGANYRAACRAKSDRDFIHKMKIVEEETDETMYWLEIIQESGLLLPDQLKEAGRETKEILAMIVASINTKLRNLKS
ncbi:four helix bundle protein [Culturomica massiliensis]|uniref:four helix bundle protein n=1 Tax=Culturomica massiliensis TaxID=1841857 RepID=UPI0008391394|nr:four helix bundle protein [Culturomica massiliensis]